VVTEADFRAAAGRVRNWGRWGGDDELGTWNLVGPEEVRASAAEIAEFVKASGAATDKGLIAFCNTGHLASIAWFGLSEVEGLKNVRLYDGSMSQWTLDPARPVVVQN